MIFMFVKLKLLAFLVQPVYKTIAYKIKIKWVLLFVDYTIDRVHHQPLYYIILTTHVIYMVHKENITQS